MWTAIVLCIVGWIVCAIAANLLLSSAVAAQAAGRNRLGVCLGCPGLLCALVAFLSFVTAFGLLVYKLVQWINS